MYLIYKERYGVNMENSTFFLRDEKGPLKPKLVFMLLPFEHTIVFEKIIKPIFNEYGLECKTANDFFTTGTLMQEIADNIRSASLIIADLTDKNANVFYELGLAHAFNKNVILITQNDKYIPSDLKANKYYPYDIRSKNGIEKFEKDLINIIEVFQFKSLIVEEFNESKEVSNKFGNEIQISSSFLMQNEGTVSIWALVKPDHDKPSEEGRTRYLISHSGNNGKQKVVEIEDEKHVKNKISIHPNSWSISRILPKGRNMGIWGFTTNRMGKPNSIFSKKKLDIGQHLFTLSWSKIYNFIKFYIDDEFIGTTTFTSWPEEFADHVFIGTWLSRYRGFYFNSKIGPYCIYRNCLGYEKVKEIYDKKEV